MTHLSRKENRKSTANMGSILVSSFRNNDFVKRLSSSSVKPVTAIRGSSTPLIVS